MAELKVSGMFITNDVALITFVPFAILTLKMGDKEKYIIPVIVEQTIAANLGSMLTPMGNPQNLYLYGVSGMSMGEFFMLTIPYILVSAVLIVILIFMIKNETKGTIYPFCLIFLKFYIVIRINIISISTCISYFKM